MPAYDSVSRHEILLHTSCPYILDILRSTADADLQYMSQSGANNSISPFFQYPLASTVPRTKTRAKRADQPSSALRVSILNYLFANNDFLISP